MLCYKLEKQLILLKLFKILSELESIQSLLELSTEPPSSASQRSQSLSIKAT
jgi:hypothetical protein